MPTSDCRHFFVWDGEKMVDVGGNDFYEVIKEYGEKVRFVDTGKEQYASIKPNMLNKAIGTTDGAYWLTGVMTFDDMADQEQAAGAYFKRSTQPNVTCMIYAIFPENATQKLAITHVVECNEKVDIVSHYVDTGEEDEYYNPIKRPVYAERDVDVFISMYTQAAKDAVVGSVDTTTMYMMIPAKYTISSENRIMKDTFVYDPETHKNVLKRLPYQVESVDTSMMDISANGTPIGILKCLLKEALE